ncbi:MAG: amidohydrolase family protein [Candidatus Hodarchaeales archaeon]
MLQIQRIFCKYALLGNNIELQKNVLVSIDSTGKIHAIEKNTSIPRDNDCLVFSDHLMIPKFINSHVHLGDSAIKNRASNLSLDAAVGSKGVKYLVEKLSLEERVNAMRVSLLEMIEYGTGVCFDFREGGIRGVEELRLASKGLPISTKILGRPMIVDDTVTLIPKVDGLGLSTPVIYKLDELKQFYSILSNKGNLIIATHIAEDKRVVTQSLGKFGISDLELALNYLKPTILTHLTQLSSDELLSIPKSTLLVFCPRSNAYFGLGSPPVISAIKLGFITALGTDNIMVNNPNILDELRWLIYRLRENNYSINHQEMLKMITSNPSSLLGLNSGVIKVGFWADLTIINLQSPRGMYSKDPLLTLLYRSQLPNDISLNLFHGQVVHIETLTKTK